MGTIRSVSAVMLTDRNGASCQAQVLAATFMSVAHSGRLRVPPSSAGVGLVVARRVDDVELGGRDVQRC